jgi:hypothetical protein
MHFSLGRMYTNALLATYVGSHFHRYQRLTRATPQAQFTEEYARASGRSTGYQVDCYRRNAEYAAIYSTAGGEFTLGPRPRMSLTHSQSKQVTQDLTMKSVDEQEASRSSQGGFDSVRFHSAV